MTASPTAPAAVPSEDLVRLVAATMEDRRRELINEPLARIWPELALAAVTAVDAYRFAFQAPAEFRALAAEAALAGERERCAEIADGLIDVQRNTVGWNVACRTISNTIRAQIDAPGASTERLS